MAVICFVDAGSTEVARFAARQLAQFSGQAGGQIGYIGCHQGAGENVDVNALGFPEAMLTGRELIAAVKRLQNSHDHVILDTSGTSDQTIALAVALSDLAITPLCLDEPDHSAFAHAVDLVRIVAENLRRPEKHCVFLTTRRQTHMAGTLLQVSGLLGMKGLTTLPVALCGWDDKAERALGAADDQFQADHSVFTRSVFDLVERTCSRIARQRLTG